jgi:hypothetical protein
MDRSRLRLTFTAGLLVLFVTACQADRSGTSAADVEVAPSRLQVSSVSTGLEYLSGSTVKHPAAGHVYATVHLEQRPHTPEEYEWIHATVEDRSYRTHKALYVQQFRSESGTQGFLGKETRIVHPSQVDIVFEIPANTTIKRLLVPLSIPLAP